MKLYWPRRSPGLPPGQRLLAEMPRFSDNPFAPPPWPPADSSVTISIEGTAVAHLDVEDALGEDVILATHLNGEPLGARHGGRVRLVAPRHYGYKSVKHLASINFTSRPPANTGKEHLRARVALQERHPKFPSWLVKAPYRLAIAPTAYFAERTLRNQRPSSAAPARAFVASSKPPIDSLVVSIYDPPDYIYCLALDTAPERFDSVDDVATAWFTKQPGWLRVISTNTLSKRRVQDAITADRYRIGTSVGSWTVIERNESEIVFGDDMGFMQYRFSFRFDSDANQIHATTIVKYLWPRAGRYYFAMVRPLHQRFVKLLLAKTLQSTPETRSIKTA